MIYYQVQYLLSEISSWQAFGEAKETRASADKDLFRFFTRFKQHGKAVRVVSVWKTEGGWTVKDVLDYKEF